MAPGHGEKKRARDRDESSDSQDKDRKRKRDKADQKEKKLGSSQKEKDRGDRKGDARKDDDRKGGKRESEDRRKEIARSQGHGYGYGGSQDDQDRRKSKRPAAEGDQRGDRENRERGDDRRSDNRDRRGGDSKGDHRDERRGDRRDRDRSRRSADDSRPPVSEEMPSSPLQKPQNWREAVEEADEDLRADSDDEEAAVMKKLEESRKRRAAMAKQVKPASNGQEGGDDAEALVGTSIVNSAAAADVVGEMDGADGSGSALGSQASAAKDAPPGDMFDTEFDISADAAKALTSGKARDSNSGLAGASTDDWDDDEGYYLAQIGELLEDRFLVQDVVCGKGVFSNVVKAKDQKTAGEPVVAIKIIRSNDMMKKAAEKEVQILQTLNNADHGYKRHIVRLIETFYYRKHIFLVFECMAEDLRVALKKFTKNKGMSLPAVKAYTKQLLIGVRHMHKFKIVHADLKPDNILISADTNVVKLCDFGTAVEQKDTGITPYLMSRFYRPSEVILGCEYGIAVDIWALSCTLIEIFTGKTPFQGKTNNDMLKRIMDMKGKLPRNVIKKGAVWKQHFDDNLDFKFVDKDSMTGEEIIRIITDNTAKKELKDYILDRVGPDKQKSKEREDQQYVKKALHFADLMDKMLALDPEKRITADDALKHHFVEDSKSTKLCCSSC
ncbi:unnamed protein product [Polarella glacialis]|uniref:non-specific serine/threonine protein kinase n=1 Tax=Polarella glacialis TaxID=89957 RepID=A0A813J727_POLGL|nr:unnamed protein product [Polarella glacialis]